MVVSRDVSIDLPAGPSEILVLADESSDPRLVALDMISQAEHGGDSVAVLVTTSRELAGKVAQEISAALPKIERHGFVAKALFECGLIFVCRDWKEGIDFVNEFAPEHVEVITKNAETIAQEITSAGIILIGPNTPVSASDYCLGTNHVLPTGGFGKRFSGLSALDYVRRYDVVRCSADQLQRITECIRTLAEAEGLPNHGLAVEERLRK
jgi:histidinol dehydrogenase